MLRKTVKKLNLDLKSGMKLILNSQTSRFILKKRGPNFNKIEQDLSPLIIKSFYNQPHQFLFSMA
jgi:hypothetical protein